MTTPVSSINVTGLTAIALAWASHASAVEFSFDAPFNADGGGTTIEFPLQLAAVQQNEVVDFTIYLKSDDGSGNLVLTDVTALGCSVSAAYSSQFDFMTSEYLTDATYTANCGNNVSAGEQGQLAINIINEEPLIMAGGPRDMAADGLYKIGWAHGGGYFMCQTFTLGGTTNPTWWPANQGLSNQITANTVGSVEFAVPTTARFALQCIPSSFTEMPVFLAIGTTVDGEAQPTPVPAPIVSPGNF